ncbi:MAG: flavocytochrome c [Duodenibacillus sp.]|nr:flavocytochrome c [Duodenibacillus sp.]
MKKTLFLALLAAGFTVAQAAQMADVVVIGAGGAGMAAAVTAHDAGAKVVILEKMAFPGGNTIRATGGINAAETPQQAKLGIKDAVETMYKDTMKGGRNLNNPELVKVLSQEANGAVQWLISLGGDFNDVGFMGGATNKRCHRPTGGAPVGPEVVKTLYGAVQARKIDLRTESQVVHLSVDKKGRVTGVEVKGPKGVYKIKAKAVVNAAGGFGANNELVASFIPKLKGFATTNHPGATGDGLLLSEEAGAGFVDIKQIQTHPTVVESNGVMITEAVRGNGAILVNTEGKRFYDELSTRDAVSAAILKQPTAHAFMFFDEDVRKSLKAIEGYIKQPGMVIQGKTLDEVAANMGVPAANLKATMAQYALDQAAGKDSCCGRTKMERPLNKPGYYAIRVTPAVHHCMGGLAINTKAQVLDPMGNVIPGYFAAGEVTGGVHGANRLGGNAQADIIVYGRIAGASAAKLAKGK